MADDSLEKMRSMIAEMQAINEQLDELDSNNKEEYDPNDPYAWLKDIQPEFYRELTKEFKKDLKKKAREEKKRKKELGRFKVVNSNSEE